jgi:phytanoyl-CoA hydroxylase
MHLSPPNHSEKSRLIYTFHMIEGEGAEYDAKNW